MKNVENSQEGQDNEVLIDTIDTTKHLCMTCSLEFAVCKSNPSFGNGYGNDNVYQCDEYLDHNITTSSDKV